MFFKINVVSRGIIFTIDILISLLAFLNSVFLFDTLPFGIDKTVPVLCALTVINTMLFYILALYKGIVRFSGIRDFIMIPVILTESGLLLMFVNNLLMKSTGSMKIENEVAVFYILIASFYMIVYRIIIARAFLFVKEWRSKHNKVIIFGADGLDLKYKYENLGRRVIAFIDDDSKKAGTMIEGTPIFDAADFKKILLKHKVQEIIFSPEFKVESRRIVLDFCKGYNIGIVLPEQDTFFLKHFLKNKRVLVTGAAGTMGSELVSQILNMDPEFVVLCDLDETGLHEVSMKLFDSNGNMQIKTCIGNVRDENRMQFLFKTYRPHYVYHMAASKYNFLAENNAIEAVKTNLQGTINIADLSVKYGAERFVMLSKRKVTGPFNIAQAARRIAELYVQSLQYPGPDVSVKSGPEFITVCLNDTDDAHKNVVKRQEACRLVLACGYMGNGGEGYYFDSTEVLRTLINREAADLDLIISSIDDILTCTLDNDFTRVQSLISTLIPEFAFKAAPAAQRTNITEQSFDTLGVIC